MVNFIESTQIGFYGKLPIIGDFVSRRLPEAFITPWDNWLQSAIAASRETLGESWLNNYLTSPIWRFLLSPGVCGNKAVAGIIMPSVDKVGRYYPLTVAVVFEQSLQLPLLFTTGNVWFEQLEDAALTGLEGNLDLQAFDQLIQNIPLFSPPMSVSPTPQISAEKKAFYISMENFGHTADAFIELNAKLLAHFMSGYSLWSNGGAEHVQSALLAYEGLPAIGNFAAFLNSKTNTKDEIIPPGYMRKLPENNSKPTVTPINSLHSTGTVSSLNSILTNDNPLSKSSCWHSWAITHTGKRRKHNEDAVLNKPNARLWMVADGMGGHKAGDIASQLIVNTLKDVSPTEPLDVYAKTVEQCLQNVNTQLRQLSTKEYGNQLVGSTVVALVCDDQYCTFLWAGDSRLYRLRDATLQQLTQDHCENDEQSSSGWSVKSVNIITRAVGADTDLVLDVGRIDVLDGDVFLLCSDGLNKEMSFKEIEHIIKNSEHHEIADALINETLARGARDNVSVIVVTKNA
jgi:type VI secretion system protein ImpM